MVEILFKNLKNWKGVHDDIHAWRIICGAWT